MNRHLEQLLDAHGVVHREQVLAHVSRHVLEGALASRQLVTLLPKLYAKPEHRESRDIMERAALMYAGAESLLSHVSALRHWNLPVPDDLPRTVHVTVPRTVRHCSQDGIVVHRSSTPVPRLRRGGLPITRLERTIMDSWALLTGADQRAPVILAVSERRTTPQRLLAAAVDNGNLKGRASLLALCDALAEGCRSELEVWGLRHVFHDDARLAHGNWQHRVRIGSRTAYLDLAFVPERVAVELDGAAFHQAYDHRERDMRRDAALTAIGWVVLRFSYHRLHNEPDTVRDEIAAVLETRRRQLAA